MRSVTAAALVFCLTGASPAPAKDAYKVEALKETAPADVSDKVRELLATEGLRVRDPKGEPFADIWLRKSLDSGEAKQAIGVKFGQIAEGSVLGVLRFHRKSSDFKGNAFPAGVYTFRNCLQPIDGDHQGVSDTRDFVLLSPVKVDTKPDPLATKEVIKLSVQVSGIKHPTVLYLTRILDEGTKPPRLVEDEDLATWTLDCAIPGAKDPKAQVRLGIVLIGKAQEH
jgi:hypothetical protein